MLLKALLILKWLGKDGYMKSKWMASWNRIAWSHGSHGEILYIFSKFLWGKPWLENIEVSIFVLSFFWDVHIDFEMPFFKGTVPKEHLTPFNATPQQQQQQQQQQQFFSGSCKWSNTHIRGAAISLIQPPPQKVSPKTSQRLKFGSMWDTFQGPLLALSCLWAQWEQKKTSNSPAFTGQKTFRGHKSFLTQQPWRWKASNF